MPLPEKPKECKIKTNSIANDGIFCSFFINISYDNFCPLFNKQFRCFSAYPTACTSNNNYFISQSHCNLVNYLLVVY